jgi:hypothetical protein
MRSCATIVELSLVALLLGATILGIFTLGPIGLFSGPLLAIFGWFYLVPIAVLVSIASAIVERPFFQRGAGACLFVLSGALVGAVFVAVFGTKEVGSVARWTVAYAVGGGVSGGTVSGLIVWLRRLPRPDDPAPPSR